MFDRTALTLFPHTKKKEREREGERFRLKHRESELTYSTAGIKRRGGKCRNSSEEMRVIYGMLSPTASVSCFREKALKQLTSHPHCSTNWKFHSDRSRNWNLNSAQHSENCETFAPAYLVKLLLAVRQAGRRAGRVVFYFIIMIFF